MSSTDASQPLVLLFFPSGACCGFRFPSGRPSLWSPWLTLGCRFDGRTIRVDKASDSGPRGGGGRGGGGGGYMGRGGYGAPAMGYAPPQGYPMQGMNMPPQAYGRGGYAPQAQYGAPQGSSLIPRRPWEATNMS